jgi:uncharacterized protein YecT (DUF1311 family)
MRLNSNSAVHFKVLRSGLAGVLILAIAAGCGIWNRSGNTAVTPEPSPEEPVANQSVSDDMEATEPDPPEQTPEASVAPANTVASNCENAQTQAEMTTCAQQSYEQANATLSQLVEQIRNQLPEGDRSSFRQVEQTWLTYRDQNCDFESSLFAGGSIEPTIYYSCLERMTSDRIEMMQDQP